MDETLSIDTQSTVSVEGLVFTLRYHPYGGAYGAPYTFVCTLVRHGKEATISGASGEMTPSVWRAIVAALLDMGIDSVRYERKGRLARTVRIDLTRGASDPGEL